LTCGTKYGAVSGFWTRAPRGLIAISTVTSTIRRIASNAPSILFVNRTACYHRLLVANQDEYARQVLHAIVTNYQQEHWDEDFQGLTKQPLVIVDYCRDAEALAAFKARYRFVNWDRAILCPDGLNEDTVRRALGRQVA
jgi:hypothetical protein